MAKKRCVCAPGRLFYVLQGKYGYGWEDLTAEKTKPEIRKRLREYGGNEGGNYRVVRRRISEDKEINV